ncbi:MAG TPA: hypothetical protein VJV75_07205 [Candidatus Polarisedimenticolia bacterium]|nr:hypothetical protein [Candidatus Polarisedimenticolia bacterium]
MKGLLSRQFKTLAGAIEVSALLEAGAVVYENPEVNAVPQPSAALEVLHRNLALTQLYLLCLWLVKDNSVNFELGFLEYPHGHPAAALSSNTIAAYFTNAQGETRVTTFNADEIRRARDYYSKLFSADHDAFTVVRIERTLPRHYNRLHRLTYYIHSARAASDVGMKISQYMTCYETLFLTDPSELSHKLAERVAYFVGTDGPERRSIYDDLKLAYSIRSKTVHGDRLSDRQANEASRLSTRCDSLLRTTLLKIVGSERLTGNFIGNSDALEDYMLKLTLGA